MKRLIIVEHPEHVTIAADRYKKEDVIIALTPFAAQRLMRNGFLCKAPRDFYRHDDFFSIYKERTGNLLDIMNRLDALLWETDKEFSENDVRPFLLSTYLFKFIIDSISYYIYLLERVIAQENPQEIFIILHKNSLKTEKNTLFFAPSTSVCYLLLRHFSRKKNFNLVGIDVHNEDFIRTIDALVNKTIDVQQGSSLFKDLAKFFFNKIDRGSGKKVLCTNCSNTKTIDAELRSLGLNIRYFNDYRLFLRSDNKPYKFAHQFMQRALMDEAIRSLSCFEGVNFLDVLETPLKYFCSKLGDFFEEYKTIENLIEKNRFDLIVLDSLAPMYTPNTMITDIARKKNTPYVCWKHGGFGLYKSFEGSDMGDFLFADYYLARGEADKNAIAAYHPACSIGASCYEKLPQRFKRNSLMPSVAGTPFLERKFNGYARPHNQRKKIVFFLGEFWIHNQYYMGGNTPYTFFQKWDEVVKIIRTLIPHQEKYEIIIKEYPNNFRTEKVKEILRENVGLRLSVKSNECSSWDLLKICDLGIFTWDSSTLYEAAYTDIDQFLFDDSELTDEAKKIIKNTFYFSDTIDAFCEQLHGYLTEGQFYQKQKAEFREKYLDFSHRSTRAERVAEIFKEIIAGRQKN